MAEELQLAYYESGQRTQPLPNHERADTYRLLNAWHRETDLSLCSQQPTPNIMKEYLKVKSIKHLNKLLKQDFNSYFILLNGGLRSSKDIYLTAEGSYQIFNDIDDSEDILTEKELFDTSITNIGKAIRIGAFYSYGY
jgi:hypothetical protein